MKQIWKYTIKLQEVQQIEMPCNARVLSVQEQDNTICLWAMVFPDASPETRKVFVFGTGQPFDVENVDFIGTVQCGSFVWHVWISR